MISQQLRTLHRTRLGRVAVGVVGLCLTFLVARFAVNSGSLWEWGLALVLLGLSSRQFVRAWGATA